MMEVIQALICIWEMGMLFYAAFQLLPQRRMHVITKIIWWMCVALDTGVAIYQRNIIMYSRSFLLLCVIITFLLMYWKCDVCAKDAFWITAFYFETIYVLDFFVLFYLSFQLRQMDFLEIGLYQIRKEWLLAFAICRLLIMLAGFLLWKKRALLLDIYKRSRKAWFVFLVLEYISLRQCDYIIEVHKQDKAIRNLMLFAVIYLVLCVAAIFVYSYQKNQHQIELLKDKNRLLEQEYQGIVDWSRGRSTLLHDIKNHLLVLEEILNAEENERALAYIHKLLATEQTRDRVIYTDNLVVNALLNEKLRVAHDRDIKIKIHIDNWKAPFVSDEDLCVIISNLLDNAIEAAGKAEGIREVSLEMQEMPWGLLIQINNSCAFEDNREAGRPKTTKKNKKEHGIGLQNVETAVSRYGGKARYEYREGRFHVDIALYRS